MSQDEEILPSILKVIVGVAVGLAALIGIGVLLGRLL